MLNIVVGRGLVSNVCVEIDVLRSVSLLVITVSPRPDCATAGGRDPPGAHEPDR